MKSYLTNYNFGDYGVSQNTDTKDYILVFSNGNYGYFDDYCENCGEKYNYEFEDYKGYAKYFEFRDDDSRYKWCKLCHINYLKNNFTNWTSGNEKIGNFIREMQLNLIIVMLLS